MQKATNNLIRELKKQKRESCSLLFLDNIKIIKDALKLGLNPKYILVESNKKELFPNYDNIKYIVENKIIKQLSDSTTPQGVVCIIEYIQDKLMNPKTNFLVLDSLQDPGNVGALIRTACACGFNDIYLIDSVKVNNSKLIRSSAGTIFLSNIYSCTKKQFIDLVNTNSLYLIKTDMKGENIFNFNFKVEKIGLVIGNEGNGVSKDIEKICKKTVSIPMLNSVESLNASISGSIIMYEIAKSKF